MSAQGYTLVKDWQDGCTPGTPGCGFQNCPKYCRDTSNSPCFGDFVVPDVDTEGYYTFVWYWEFTRPSEPYISCYEAYVTQTAPTTTLTVMPSMMPSTQNPSQIPTTQPTFEN